MTDTIQTPADTADTDASEAVPAEEFLHLHPADIIIGSNVRTDVRADHKEFCKSIKERGVLEAVTVYRNEDGQYVLLRGQRRTITAAKVGTPTGLIPARVVPQPADADRIGDQMVENIHRAGMREAEIVAGVEQLALLGVSAAQIAKRTSIDRPTVNAALAVTKADQSRNRLDAGDLTLEEAAIFAEFEHDPEAVERLENAKRYRQSLAHVAQRLRDEAAEREADAAEVERLRAEGLPVLSAEEVAEVAEADEVLRIERLVTEDGEPLPEEEWPDVPGARVQVVKEWVYAEDEYDEEQEDGSDEEDEDDEPYQQYVPVWVVTDLAASGLRRRGGGSGTTTADSGNESESEEEAEARREERRRVIANNKAWASGDGAPRVAGRVRGPQDRPEGCRGPDLRGRRDRPPLAEQGDGPPAPDALHAARDRRPDRLLRRGVRGVPQDRDQGEHAEGRDHDHSRRRRCRVGGHDRQALVAQPDRVGCPRARRARGVGLPAQRGRADPARRGAVAEHRGRRRRRRRGQRQRRLIGSPSPTEGGSFLWRTALSGIETIE